MTDDENTREDKIPGQVLAQLFGSVLDSRSSDKEQEVLLLPWTILTSGIRAPHPENENICLPRTIFLTIYIPITRGRRLDRRSDDSTIPGPGLRSKRYKATKRIMQSSLQYFQVLHLRDFTSLCARPQNTETKEYNCGQGD